MNIAKNIEDVRVLKGMSQQEMSSLLGISQQVYSNLINGRTKKIDPKYIDIIKRDLNIDVLQQNIVTEISIAPTGRLPKKIEYGKPIPFYDIDFAAGDIEFYNGQSSIQAAYTMDIPEFSGCTAFRSYGDSMEKLIKSGDILFGTKIEDWQSHLEYGQVYGIICNDGRRYLKFIRKAINKEETHFLLKSENKEYDDFIISKSKIKSIWLIHGWMNKRT